MSGRPGQTARFTTNRAMTATRYFSPVLPAQPAQQRGCDAVKALQSPEDGRWWRSPKKLREKPPEGAGGETTFSNDHAQGVWAYIAETKDTNAFRGWTGWIAKNSKQLGFIPRYCEDDRCGFKFTDCPMLDRLAVRLEIGNPICDLVPIPPLPIVDLAALADEIVGLRKMFEAAEKLVTAVLPGATALAGLNPLRKKFDDLMNKMRSKVDELIELQSRMKTLQRVAIDSAGVVNCINSIGWMIHDTMSPPRSSCCSNMAALYLRPCLMLRPQYLLAILRTPTSSS